MTAKDYIFRTLGHDHVATLKDNQIIRVSKYAEDFILTEDGRMYFMDTEAFFNNLIGKNFWTAVAWKRNCILNIMIP